MIEMVQEVIHKIKGNIRSLDNHEDLIYSSLLKAICHFDNNESLVEKATGLHFVESGEVLVVSAGATPNARLNKSDIFGTCDFFRSLVSIATNLKFYVWHFAFFCRDPSSWATFALVLIQCAHSTSRMRMLKQDYLSQRESNWKRWTIRRTGWKP